MPMQEGQAHGPHIEFLVFLHSEHVIVFLTIPHLTESLYAQSQNLSTTFFHYFTPRATFPLQCIKEIAIVGFAEDSWQTRSLFQ